MFRTKLHVMHLAIAMLGVFLGVRSAGAADRNQLMPRLSSSAPVTKLSQAAASDLDLQLRQLLARAGFTGKIEAQLEARLGRPVNKGLSNVGRLLFFDSIQGLRNDNSCAGCHAPANGFGDTQSIAIGVENNGRVGPGRVGPRNQRRSPMILNTAFFPKLMWNGRFSAPSGDPFDNSRGFSFPLPEGSTFFRRGDVKVKHLLAAQGHIPQTEIVEMAGFTGTRGTFNPRFDDFDNGLGDIVPLPGANGFRNDPVRGVVLGRINGVPGYVNRFAKLYPDVARGGPVTFAMIGQALAEFQISLTFANAPIDRFAQGHRSAMTAAQKRGAILFFGSAGCISCHSVAGRSNEMFSDFENHVIGVPQIAPVFGPQAGNVLFDGPGEDEDFGLEQVTGNAADRYKFRTSPLRNVALQPTFFHNGAFTSLEDAVRHHLDVVRSVQEYSPERAGLELDLSQRQGPMSTVLSRLDPRLSQPRALSPDEIEDLVTFVREGLLDARAKPENLCKLVPRHLPSGREVANFESCE